MRVFKLDHDEPELCDKRTVRVSKYFERVTIVVGESDTMMHGNLLDESYGGLGVVLDDVSGFEVYDEVKIIREGVPLHAVITNIREEDCILGLQWKAVAISRHAREKLDASSDRFGDEKMLGFVRLVPSSVYSMWRFYESHKLVQLQEAAERLRRQAASFGVSSLKPIILALDAAIESNDEPAVLKHLNRLVEACVDLCDA